MVIMRHGCMEDIIEKLEQGRLSCSSFSTTSSVQPCRMMTTLSSRSETFLFCIEQESLT